MIRRRVSARSNGATTLPSPTPLYTLAQLQAVTEAIASGVTRVAYDGKSSEFRSLDDLLRLQEIMQNALGLQEAGRTTTTVLVAHDRGYPNVFTGGYGYPY
jgi:hypothetical protein